MPDFPTQGTPPFINRALSVAEWLDYVKSYDFGPIAPSRVVLHHTYIPTVAQWRGLTTLRGIQRFYAGKGWQSGPHMFIGPDAIWLATPMEDVGIHAGTGNSGRINGRFWYSIGVEMVGYYDKERPSGAIWEQTKAVLGSLSRRLGIAPRELISFHRDYTNQKSCPGWAVTKDWVYGEVEAWLRGQQSPPPPPKGPIGIPTPDNEKLVELLKQASYSHRSQGYNSGWAFHEYAVKHKLGAPIGKSARIQVDGKSYAYQPFAHDTLYNEVPHWGDVRVLSELLGGSIPPGGLGRALLDATYQAGGARFHPEWAFHQYAVASKLGPPIGGSQKITVDGVQYSFQVFALDTIYNVIPNWTDIQRVSRLANTTNPGQVRLRDTLLAYTYRRVNATYHPEWAFHQLARKWNVGVPLSGSYRISSGNTQYALQVYAADTLYNVVPNWSDVRRLSELTGPKGAVLSVVSTLSSITTALLPADTQFAPIPTPFEIMQYINPEVTPTAFGRRSGSKIGLIVLHGNTRPTETVLDDMTRPGSRAMSHYYISNTGDIHQLVDDQFAAWHAGLAHWEGRLQNINRIALGITLEWPGNSINDTQREALIWLVNALRERYDLPVEAVKRWSDINPRRNDGLTTFPWMSFTEQLAAKDFVTLEDA